MLLMPCTCCGCIDDASPCCEETCGLQCLHEARLQQCTLKYWSLLEPARQALTAVLHLCHCHVMITLEASKTHDSGHRFAQRSKAAQVL